MTGMLLGAFSLVSLFYVFVGVRCLYRVITRWPALWDDDVTRDDLVLAGEASFFLLIPPTVILHELGHAAALWSLGLGVASWGFLGYMGWVVPTGSAGPLGDFGVALAGNLVTLAIGAGTLAWGVLRPGHPVRNVLMIDLGRRSLFLVLIFYPAICVAFAGDFQRIYDFDATPVASGITAAVHVLILALGYGVLWKRLWRPRAMLLCSPLAPKLLAAEARLAGDPGDLGALRVLGLLHFTSGDHARAVAELAPVVAAGGVDPRVRTAYGAALTETGDHEAAVAQLRQALTGLLRPEDRLGAELPLARALTALGRAAEARALLEPLLERYPGEAAVRELWDRARRASA